MAEASPHAVISLSRGGALTFVCWRWRPPAAYRSTFGPETVRILRNMIGRHYQAPHRVLCVTDHPEEIDPDIETLKLWDEWGNIPSPYGTHNPSCYRRLRLFAPDAAEVFGDVDLFSMDLDTVIVRDISPLVDRPEEFIAFGETDSRSYYNGSFIKLKAGTRTKVYTQFNPATSPPAARKAGRFGSDQGHISHILGKGEAIYRPKDGVYSFRVHLKNGTLPLPKDARLLSFHGGQDPWGQRAQHIDWVKRHYQ